MSSKFLKCPADHNSGGSYDRYNTSVTAITVRTEKYLYPSENWRMTSLNGTTLKARWQYSSRMITWFVLHNPKNKIYLAKRVIFYPGKVPQSNDLFMDE